MFEKKKEKREVKRGWNMFLKPTYLIHWQDENRFIYRKIINIAMHNKNSFTTFNSNIVCHFMHNHGLIQ